VGLEPRWVAVYASLKMDVEGNPDVKQSASVRIAKSDISPPRNGGHVGGTSLHR
jgi:hypothetical protein